MLKTTSYKTKKVEVRKEKTIPSQDLKDGLGQPIIGVKSEQLGAGEIEGFDPTIKE